MARDNLMANPNEERLKAKVEQAKKLIGEINGDTKVPKSKTRELLGEIADEVMGLIEALGDV